MAIWGAILFKLIEDIISFHLYISNYLCFMHLQDCGTFILKLYGLLMADFLSFYTLLRATHILRLEKGGCEFEC